MWGRAEDVLSNHHRNLSAALKDLENGIGTAFEEQTRLGSGCKLRTCEHIRMMHNIMPQELTGNTSATWAADLNLSFKVSLLQKVMVGH